MDTAQLFEIVMDRLDRCMVCEVYSSLSVICSVV